TKGHGIEMPRLYAVEASRHQVLRGGADRTSQPRMQKEQPHGHRQRNGNSESQKPSYWQHDWAPLDAVARIRGVDGAEVGRKRELGEVSQHDLQPERYLQGVEHGGADDQVQKAALHRVTDDKHHDCGNRQSQERVDTGVSVEIPGHVRTEHDECAVRQIDDIQYSPNQGETERHHSVQSAQKNSVDQDLRKKIHIALFSWSRWFVNRLTRVPGRHRIFRLRDLAIGAIDCGQLVSLHLDDGLGQVDLTVVVECNRAVETVELHFRERVSYLRRINRACVFHGLRQRFDIGDTGSSMIVWIVTEFRLVGHGELPGVAEPAILEFCGWQPGRHAEGVVRVLAQGLTEILAGDAHRERIHLRRDRKALGLSYEIQYLGLVAGHQHHIYVLASDLREQRIEVCGVGAISLVHRQCEACLLQFWPCAIRHRNVEGVVSIKQRNRFWSRTESLQHVYRRAKIIARRRQRSKDKFELAREYLVGGTASLNHWNSVFLRHRRIRQRKIACEWSEQKIDLVLRNQLGVLAHA